MLVVGGYVITYDHLRHLGARRGLVIEGGNASILNRDLRRKGIRFIHVLPVDCPRRTPTTPGVPRILIASRRRDDYLVHLADCKPFIKNKDDLKVKQWLEINGIPNAPFMAIPDPFGTYNEYGEDYD